MSAFPWGWNALWRSGHVSGQFIETGLYPDEFVQKDLANFNNGFRLRLAYYENDSYSVVWEHGTGGQQCLRTTDDDEFKSMDVQMLNLGRRLTYFDVREGNIVAIWRDGGGEERWAMHFTFDNFKQQDEEFEARGLVLQRLVDDGGSYSGYWRTGKQRYKWIHEGDNDENEFNSNVEAFAKQGFLAVSYSDPFTSVFHEGKGEQRWEIGLLINDFTTRSELLYKANFHCVDLHLTI